MSTPAHVTFFLLPGFNLAALGAAAGVLAEEARHIPFTTMGLDGAPVSASCGIALRPDQRAEEMAAETAILIILAGRDQEAETVEAALVVLRRARRRGVVLWSIGAGVLLLARLGLEPGAQITAHPDLAEALRGLTRRVDISHVPFVWSPGLATARATGAAALMRHALAEARIAAAEDIARRAEVARSLLEPVEERYDTSHKTVLAGLSVMRENLFQPLPISVIAARVQVSERQLSRLFERELGDTPQPVYRAMRMEAARVEVRDGRRPMQEIARDFGMDSGHFSKTYLKQFGIAPSADRRSVIDGGNVNG
ncbi:helix-turn-helix domain-containing protein [Alterinioella nitratireducens]|uniref:helix-turn-helix domain-containing protein n=1 Tax=Alterinioella nitratireducens TaxID=2735915 RepID=UPI001553C17E|nr:helix-turn-helix domain-containing protein [Alterinioella nitratireducens]NPD20853.1 helix-turn-helix domain-containing protein [Alterinioella nitratireducens]